MIIAHGDSHFKQRSEDALEAPSAHARAVGDEKRNNYFAKISVFIRGFLHINIPLIPAGSIDWIVDPEEQINPAISPFFSLDKGLPDENPRYIRVNKQIPGEEREIRSLKPFFNVSGTNGYFTQTLRGMWGDEIQKLCASYSPVNVQNKTQQVTSFRSLDRNDYRICVLIRQGTCSHRHAVPPKGDFQLPPIPPTPFL
jgi:hypothetical protein